MKRWQFIALVSAIPLTTLTACTEESSVHKQHSECRAQGGEFKQDRLLYNAVDGFPRETIVSWCELPGKKTGVDG